MHIIYRNEPLLFVNGPPVFIKVVVAVEESTSVFILDSEYQIEQEKEEQLTEQLIDVETLLETNLAIQRKIIYLNNSFRRMVYQPLQFVMEGETVTGAIEKIEEKTVWIDLTGMHQDLVAVEMGKIEEVLWRGKPFDETK
ncbi:hypothetical protein FQ087_10965 [Sporosarcina sp. ANT_H38]|uniref:hypothetical protein n=1 Tax=Sporosarcina sp. ANT_H38 TaxID=2597358 RepID=UPI0011F225E2|nr:hypothetical protein [Sporosarcina sp. ANT_H38]KAA0966717.1 hypothetical protein FQ087_10965 [Sporosarcina sp. ANT_H38]